MRHWGLPLLNGALTIVAVARSRSRGAPPLKTSQYDLCKHPSTFLHVLQHWPRQVQPADWTDYGSALQSQSTLYRGCLSISASTMHRQATVESLLNTAPRCPVCLETAKCKRRLYQKATLADYKLGLSEPANLETSLVHSAASNMHRHKRRLAHECAPPSYYPEQPVSFVPVYHWRYCCCVSSLEWSASPQIVKMYVAAATKKTLEYLQ